MATVVVPLFIYFFFLFYVRDYTSLMFDEHAHFESNAFLTFS